MAMSQAKIESNAETDPDNPPMTEEELARIRAAQAARLKRERTG
jgi:uncharacterized short protein YbdD (DUF466 family)